MRRDGAKRTPGLEGPLPRGEAVPAPRELVDAAGRREADAGHRASLGWRDWGAAARAAQASGQLQNGSAPVTERMACSIICLNWIWPGAPEPSWNNLASCP